MLNVFELRNYEMRPGGRDVLIDLFERHFVEPQEDQGAFVVGTFRHIEDPNRFVWLRGFESMEARLAALNGFYTGPVWRQHRTAANATMIDSDNVLLLRPVDAAALRAPGPPPSPSATDAVLVARIYHLSPGGAAAFAALFRREALPRLGDVNATPGATFVTEDAPNTFPALPVREGETVFVTLTRFASPEAFARQRAGLIDLDRRVLSAAPEIMPLAPTPRSRLR